MVDERYHFADRRTRYNAMGAAEHLVRYHAVRELCVGKRVLDVACGEGYGSYLMATWGAAQVVGIDVAGEAIDLARQLFGHPNITYHVGDACRLVEVLGEATGFDLIVSFETIEHVGDVEGLLRGFAACRAPGGAIVISCPNDYVDESINPFHKRRYTFEEFQRTTTAVLGPASEWRLGTPLQGQVLHDVGPLQFVQAGAQLRDPMLCWQDIDRAVMIPAQPETAPDATTSRFYIGCWGAVCGQLAVFAAMSYPALVGPWVESEFLKAEIEAAVRALRAADGAEETEHAPVDVAELKRRIAARAASHAKGISQIQGEPEAGEAPRRELVDQLRCLAGKLDAATATITQLSEDRAEQDEQLADLRRRTILYIRQAQDLGAELSALRQENAQLATDARRWREIRTSRSYRVVRLYVSAYDLPVVGHGLCWLRRQLGRARRAVSGRQ